MALLKTTSGEVEFIPVDIGDKKWVLDRKVCKNNLLDLNVVFKNNEIHFGLWKGTLLGAIREGNFIEGDSDVDVFALLEQQQAVIDCLPHLLKLGFKVARYREGSLLSVIKEENYIDIYFYKRKGENRVWDETFIKSNFLEERGRVTFLGETFPIPSQPKEVLSFVYGKNWITPDAFGSEKNLTWKGKAQNSFSKLRLAVIKRFPRLQKLYRAAKRLV
jgi:hypothetical protein